MIQRWFLMQTTISKQTSIKMQTYCTGINFSVCAGAHPHTCIQVTINLIHLFTKAVMKEL